MMAPERLAAEGLFNPGAVTKLVEKCAGNPSPGFRADTAFVGILSTGLWLDTFAKSGARAATKPENEAGKAA